MSQKEKLLQEIEDIKIQLTAVRQNLVSLKAKVDSEETNLIGLKLKLEAAYQKLQKEDDRTPKLDKDEIAREKDLERFKKVLVNILPKL